MHRQFRKLTKTKGGFPNDDSLLKPLLCFSVQILHDFRTINVMNNEYTAVLKQDEGWWVGWIQEVPGVNCQERSKEELLASLRQVLGEALEFNREEARMAAGGDFLEEPLAL